LKNRIAGINFFPSQIFFSFLDYDVANLPQKLAKLFKFTLILFPKLSQFFVEKMTKFVGEKKKKTASEKKN
jgi:hypothetical protein